MAKLRYTRDQMEELILRQLDHMEALGDQNRLLRKHNELLEKKVQKLKEQLSGKKKPKHYVTTYPRKSEKWAPITLAADQQVKKGII